MDQESQGTMPLATPIPTPESPHKSNDIPEPRKLENYSRRRKVLCCCGICSAIVLVLIILLIILIVTVFKQKDPRIKVDSITLEGLNFNVGNFLTNPQDTSVDFNLGTTVSVKNPNYAGFAFKNSTAYITYHGRQLAYTPVPAGSVKARKTVTLETTTEVHISAALLDADLIKDVITDITSGILPISTAVRVQGTAKVLGFLKVKHVKTTALCDVSVFIANLTESFHCNYKVKI